MTFGGEQAQPSAKVGEVAAATFDFTSSMGVAETISTQVVTSTVYSGTDASPSGVISGSATASGKVVSQTLVGDTAGVIYELLCTITTSLSRTLKMSSYFAVTPNLV